MAVNLSKGQKISLEKEAGGALQKIIMGLGWDSAKGGGGGGGLLSGLFGGGGRGDAPVDLDASCVIFDEQGNNIDTVWFRQLKSKDGSIVHTGDNRTGEGEGDDEQILVNLAQIPANIKSLVFVVNNFTGQDFSTISNAFCRMVNAANNQEIARYSLDSKGNHNAQVMAKVYRHNGEWKMHAIGENATGRTFNDLMPNIKPHL